MCAQSFLKWNVIIVWCIVYYFHLRCVLMQRFTRCLAVRLPPQLALC